MTSALKMTALRIADCGVARSMTLSVSSTGNAPANMAGMMAKYLATSLEIENVVSEPRVMSSCLPISTISMSLVGLESRSTMLPASRAACVPLFIATPTSAWARAGASLVPSPVMATSAPPACSRRMSAILSSGVASARKSSTPASSAMARAVQRVVAGDHDRADAHAPQLVEALAHAVLDDVLEADDAEGDAVLGDDQRRAAGGGDAVDELVELAGGWLAAFVEMSRRTASAAPLRIERPSMSTPLMRVCAVNGMSVRARELALAQVEALLGEDHDRAPLRRLVGQAGELRRVGELPLGDARAAAGTPPPDGCRA